MTHTSSPNRKARQPLATERSGLVDRKLADARSNESQPAPRVGDSIDGDIQT